MIFKYDPQTQAAYYETRDGWYASLDGSRYGPYSDYTAAVEALEKSLGVILWRLAHAALLARGALTINGAPIPLGQRLAELRARIREIEPLITTMETRP